MSINSLPTELVIYILTHVSLGELLKMRTISKQYQHIINITYWDHVWIHINKKAQLSYYITNTNFKKIKLTKKYIFDRDTLIQNQLHDERLPRVNSLKFYLNSETKSFLKTLEPLVKNIYFASKLFPTAGTHITYKYNKYLSLCVPSTYDEMYTLLQNSTPGILCNLFQNAKINSYINNLLTKEEILECIILNNTNPLPILSCLKEMNFFADVKNNTELYLSLLKLYPDPRLLGYFEVTDNEKLYETFSLSADNAYFCKSFVMYILERHYIFTIPLEKICEQRDWETLNYISEKEYDGLNYEPSNNLLETWTLDDVSMFQKKVYSHSRIYQFIMFSLCSTYNTEVLSYIDKNNYQVNLTGEDIIYALEISNCFKWFIDHIKPEILLEGRMLQLLVWKISVDNFFILLKKLLEVNETYLIDIYESVCRFGRTDILSKWSEHGNKLHTISKYNAYPASILNYLFERDVISFCPEAYINCTNISRALELCSNFIVLQPNENFLGFLNLLFQLRNVNPWELKEIFPKEKIDTITIDPSSISLSKFKFLLEEGIVRKNITNGHITYVNNYASTENLIRQLIINDKTSDSLKFLIEDGFKVEDLVDILLGVTGITLVPESYDYLVKKTMLPNIADVSVIRSYINLMYYHDDYDSIKELYRNNYQHQRNILTEVMLLLGGEISFEHIKQLVCILALDMVFVSELIMSYDYSVISSQKYVDYMYHRMYKMLHNRSHSLITERKKHCRIQISF